MLHMGEEQLTEATDCEWEAEPCLGLEHAPRNQRGHAEEEQQKDDCGSD